MIDISKIQTEREAVLKNIQALEQQIATLSQQLQQANANLIASRGAVLAFDRLLETQEPAEKAE